jgi:hypothetical protein
LMVCPRCHEEKGTLAAIGALALLTMIHKDVGDVPNERSSDSALIRTKAERRLETVALIGLTLLIARLLRCADGRCLTAPETVDGQPLLRVPVRRDGLKRGPAAPEDWSLHGERGRSGSDRGCDVVQAVGRAILG